MASANYVLLEKITVGAAGASSVTFNSIPQTGYTDLVVKMSARDATISGGFSTVYMKFNGSTLNRSSRWISGNGSVASSSSASDMYLPNIPALTATTSTFGNMDVYIPNYSGSQYKSYSADVTPENNGTLTYMTMTAGLWSDTSAITSITYTSDGTFAQYSTFYLYGVAKLGTTPAIVPYATGGDTIMTDGTYWYHTFISSGTFTPSKALSCDYLLVSGGGAGGWGADTSRGGGGGGAGGMKTLSSQSLSTTGYTVTVGAGGSSSSQVDGASPSGSSSSFNGSSTTGGGGGAEAQGYNGGNGGSGGGNGGYSGSGTTAGTGVSGEGNAGYASAGTTNRVGAGGGGKSAAATGQAGGAGATNAISGTSTTYAIGGSGGNLTGGAGSAGAANTGNGGNGGDGKSSGSGVSYTGGNGGSGIVVVRYAI